LKTAFYQILYKFVVNLSLGRRLVEDFVEVEDFVFSEDDLVVVAGEAGLAPKIRLGTL
jgi:hypothetical protein